MSFVKTEQTLRMSNLFGKKVCSNAQRGKKKVYLKAKI